MEWTEASQCMLKPREFVPWGLPGPTLGRRDAAENEGGCSDGAEGRGGAHRLHVSPSYAAFRTALGIETDPWHAFNTSII